MTRYTRTVIRVKTLRGEELSWDGVGWDRVSRDQLRPVALSAPAQAEQKVDLKKRVAGYSEWAHDAHHLDLPEGRAPAFTQQAPSGYWVDVQAPTPEEVKALRAVFPLHPLALEDAQEEGHWSRFETYPAHDFITYRTLSRAEECDDFSQRISIFVFPGSVVSYSRSGTVYLDTVWGLLGRESVNTPNEVAYELIDHGTDTFGVYANALETQIENEEEVVVRHAGQDITTAVFEFKHNLARVRRLCAEAREAVLLLARHGHAEGGDLIRYRDALSNLDRAVSRLDAQREALTNLLDTSLGFQSQRLNQVIRTLTVVSTFFLPLTFLAGVWGMNFKFMPELEWRYGYAMAWGSFILTAASMAYYFKRRGWW